MCNLFLSEQVKSSFDTLNVFIQENKCQTVEISETSETRTCLEEEFSNETSLKKRYPFFHYFNGVYNKVDKKLPQTEISLSNENYFHAP